MTRYGKFTHLRYGINKPADRQDALYSTLLVVTDGALGTRDLANLGHVLSTLADDSRGFRTGDHRSNMDPRGLIIGVGWRDRLGRDVAPADDAEDGSWQGVGEVGNGRVALRIFCLALGPVGLDRAVSRRRRHRGRDRRETVGLFSHFAVVPEDLIKRRSLGLGLVCGPRRGRGLLQRALGRLCGLRRGRHDRLDIKIRSLCASVFLSP